MHAPPPGGYLFNVHAAYLSPVLESVLAMVLSETVLEEASSPHWYVMPSAENQGPLLLLLLQQLWVCFCWLCLSLPFLECCSTLKVEVVVVARMNLSSETAAVAATVAAAAGVVLPAVHNSTKLNELLCCLHVMPKLLLAGLWQKLSNVNLPLVVKYMKRV